MPKIVILGALAAAAVHAPVAAATAWHGVTRDIDKALVYIDADNVRDEGTAKTTRVLFDYLEPQHRFGTFTQWFQSVEALITVRCSDRSYELKAATVYSGQHGRGEVLAKGKDKPAEQPYEREVPFTNSQAVINYLCTS